MAGSGLRSRFSTLRARTVAGACIVVTVALLCGYGLLVIVLRHTLTTGVDDAARQRTREVAAFIADNDLSSIISPGRGDNSFEQVVGPSGRVIASSANLEGRPPIASFRPTAGRSEVRTLHALPVEADPGDAFRVVALTVPVEGGRATIYIGNNLERVAESVVAVRRILLLSVPLLVGLVGAVSWYVIGRALRPVDAISREVADIEARDLTQRVAEPHGDDEIGRLARTMNQMLDRLQRHSEQQRRFVADASHELRSPLAASRAHLEVALRHPDASDWPTTAAGLAEDIERMTKLNQDLLLLARADDATAELASVPVDLDDVVRIEMDRAELPATLALDASRITHVEVLGRPDELGRVVRNLLDNASRHARSTVGVELAHDGRMATLVVSDDGDGIAPEERERIFERFTRLDDSRSRDTGGSGLGLAIVREIVTGHRGTVTLEPDDGRTRFVVRLPAAES